MRVTALRSFVAMADGASRTYARGAEFDLPAGVDWLAAGLVAPVAPHLAGVERAIDASALTAERRTFGGMLVSGLGGIGSKTAARLAAQGIETVDELLMTDPALVASVAGVSAATVAKWRQRATAAAEGGA